MSAPKDVTRLLNDLKKVLWLGHSEGVVATPPQDINEFVKLGTAPQEIVLTQHAWAIVGGGKDHKRRSKSARLVRTDGAWLHFTVAVTETAKVLAYDFELVFDQMDEPRKARFMRIDLNPIGHDNDRNRDRRCHLHPGHDEVQVPWREQPPVEILELLVNDLRFIKER